MAGIGSREELGKGGLVARDAVAKRLEGRLGRSSALGAEGLDLGLTGFDQAELDRLLAPVTPPELSFQEFDERGAEPIDPERGKKPRTVPCPHCGGDVVV